MNWPVLPATAHTNISENNNINYYLNKVCKSACRERLQVTSANQNEPQKMTVELIISLQ